MLTKEQWKQAPPWANAFYNGGFVNLRPYDKAFSKAEPRPFDTYPCPFCGGTDLLLEQDFGFYRVECQTNNPTPCISGPVRLTEEDAWQAWATRV